MKTQKEKDMSNVTIKRRAVSTPAIPDVHDKYKFIHYTSCNFYEVVTKHLSTLNKDQVNEFWTEFFELSYTYNGYREADGYLYFKSCSNANIVGELSKLASMFKELSLLGGSIKYSDSESAPTFDITIQNGQVEVFV